MLSTKLAIEDLIRMNNAKHVRSHYSAIVRLAVVVILLIPLTGCFVVELMMSKQIDHISISPSSNEIAFLQFPNQVRVKSLDNDGEDKCKLRVPLNTEEVHYTSHGAMLAVDQPVNGDAFGVGNVNRMIAIYDVSTCERARHFQLVGLDTTTALAFSRDGSFLLRSSQESGNSDPQLDLIDGNTGDSIEQWTYPDTHPISFALSGDDSLVLVGMAQHKAPEDDGVVPPDHIGKAVLMRIPTGEVVREWVESETLGIRAVAISSDGTTIAFKLYDGTIKTTHLPTGAMQTLLTPMQGVEAHLKTFDGLSTWEKLVLSPSGSLLFTYSVIHADTVYGFDVDSGELVKEYVYEEDIGDFAITSDGKRLVVGTEAGEIEIENLAPLMESV